jgi:Maltose operon periplasmic protein precursor (MalM)
MALSLSLAVVASGAERLTDPEQFDYQALPNQGTVAVSVDAHSPHFEFRSGDSAFAAFRLPTADRAYLIDVVAPLQPTSDLAHGAVFYPAVALLSEQFILVRASEGAPWHFDRPEFGLTTVPAYRLTIDIQAGGPERYLIVYTPRDATTRALPGAASVGPLRITVSPAPSE